MFKRALVLLLVSASSLAQAELVHNFQSPAFIPGNGYSQHVLSIYQLEENRKKEIKAEEAAADRVRQDLEKRQAAIAQMEADGKAGTPEHTKAVYAFKAAEVAGSAKITERALRENQSIRSDVRFA